MKHLRSHRRVIGGITIYAKEYPTIWEVSTKVERYANSNRTNVRYKKREYKTLDDLAKHIANSVRSIYEYENQFGVQRVCCTYAEYLMLKMCYSLSGLNEEEYELYKTMS